MTSWRTTGVSWGQVSGPPRNTAHKRLVDGMNVKVAVTGRAEAGKTMFVRQLVGKPWRSSYKPTTKVRVERVLVNSSDSKTFTVDVYEVPQNSQNSIRPDGVINILGNDNNTSLNFGSEDVPVWRFSNRRGESADSLKQNGKALWMFTQILRRIFEKGESWEVRKVTRMNAKMVMPGVSMSVLDSRGQTVKITPSTLVLGPEIDLQSLSKRGISVGTPLQACIQELVRFGHRSSDVFLMTQDVQDELLAVLPLIDPIDFAVTVPQSLFVLETNKRVLEIQEMVQSIARGIQIGQCVANNKDKDFSKCQLILGTSKAIAQAVLSGGLNLGSLRICVFDSPGNKCSDEFQELIMSKLREDTQVLYNTKTLGCGRGVFESHWCSKFRPNMVVVQCFKFDDIKT